MTKFEEEFDKNVHVTSEMLTGRKICSANQAKALGHGWVSPEEHQARVDELIETKEKNIELLRKNATLKSQFQQQALPVVPEDVAKLPPFDGMKEYVLDERLLTIREFLNKLNDKSNSDITEAEAWCMIHEDIAYRAMLDGYTVEKSDKCMVKLGALYFKCWNDVDAVFIIDDQPGAYESAFVFKKREDAEKVAQLVGGRVVKN